MDIKFLDDIVNGILELKPPVLLVLVLNGLGFVLKSIEKFPNKYIPVVLVAAGTVTFPYMLGKTSLVLDVYNPTLYSYVLGCALGLASTGLYELLKNFDIQAIATGFLKKWISRLAPQDSKNQDQPK